MLLGPHAHDHDHVTLTDLALTELRREARGEPSVIEALFGVPEALASVAPEPH